MSEVRVGYIRLNPLGLTKSGMTSREGETTSDTCHCRGGTHTHEASNLFQRFHVKLRGLTLSKAKTVTPLPWDVSSVMSGAGRSFDAPRTQITVLETQQQQALEDIILHAV